MTDEINRRIPTNKVVPTETSPFSKGDPAAAIRLLRQWREQADAIEDRQTFEALRRALNESRPPDCWILP